jgi:hypothetical protein
MVRPRSAVKGLIQGGPEVSISLGRQHDLVTAIRILLPNRQVPGLEMVVETMTDISEGSRPRRSGKGNRVLTRSKPALTTAIIINNALAGNRRLNVIGVDNVKGILVTANDGCEVIWC